MLRRQHQALVPAQPTMDAATTAQPAGTDSPNLVQLWSVLFTGKPLASAAASATNAVSSARQLAGMIEHWFKSTSSSQHPSLSTNL